LPWKQKSASSWPTLLNLQTRLVTEIGKIRVSQSTGL
jgi:hypothetical protein